MSFASQYLGGRLPSEVVGQWSCVVACASLSQRFCLGRTDQNISVLKFCLERNVLPQEGVIEIDWWLQYKHYSREQDMQLNKQTSEFKIEGYKNFG